MKVQLDDASEDVRGSGQAWENGPFHKDSPAHPRTGDPAPLPTQELMPESWNMPHHLWTTGILTPNTASANGHHVNLDDSIQLDMSEHRNSYMSTMGFASVVSGTNPQTHDVWKIPSSVECSAQTRLSFMSAGVPCTLAAVDNPLGGSTISYGMEQYVPRSQIARLIWLRNMLLPSQRSWCIDSFIADLGVGQVPENTGLMMKGEAATQLCSTLEKIMRESIQVLAIQSPHHMIVPHPEYGGEGFSFLSAPHMSNLVQSGLRHLGHYSFLSQALTNTFLEVVHHPTHIDWLIIVAQGLLGISSQASQELGHTLLEACNLNLKYRIVSPSCWSVTLFSIVAGWSGSKSLEDEAAALLCKISFVSPSEHLLAGVQD